MDVAAGLLNTTTQNHAVGGATSGAVPGQLGIPKGFANLTAATAIDVPSTLEQVTTLTCICLRRSCPWLFHLQELNEYSMRAGQTVQRKVT